jgi:hypothetical protein
MVKEVVFLIIKTGAHPIIGFTPAPANYAVNATFGQFTATAINPSGGLNSNGAATGWYNLKAGGSGTGTTLSQGPNKVIYQAVVAANCFYIFNKQ